MSATSGQLSVKRSFIEPYAAIKQPKSVRKTAKTATATPPPPRTEEERLQAAVQLLLEAHSNGGGVRDQVVQLCQDTATRLIEEARRVDARAKRQAAAEAAVYSPREGEDGEEATEERGGGSHASVVTEQATLLLVAATLAALESRQSTVVAKAIPLAEAAVEVRWSLLTTTTLATAFFYMGSRAQDIQQRTAAYQNALTIINSASAPVLSSPVGGPLANDDEASLTRMAWLLSGMGHHAKARDPISAVLRANPSNYMALLLLSLLHGIDGDMQNAYIVAVRLLTTYPDDVVAVILHLVVQWQLNSRGNENGTRYSGQAAMESVSGGLALAVARAEVATAEAAAAEAANTRKKSLKGLAVHCAPDEHVEGGPDHSAVELRRRSIGNWALIGYLASRFGCESIAELAIDAGMAQIAVAQRLYTRSFVNLQCARARLTLRRIEADASASWRKSQARESTAPTAVPLVLRSLNLTEQFHLYSGQSRDATLETMLPLTTGTTDRELLQEEANCAVPPQLFDDLIIQLTEAEDVCPTHPDTYHLRGVARLLEAAQPHLSSTQQRLRLEEAGDYFMKGIRADPSSSMSYLGSGATAEAQGALDIAFDFYSSAAEVSLHESLIPWNAFAFLYQ